MNAMSIEFDSQPQYTTVTYQQSRMDAASAPAFVAAVKEHIADGENRLILDLHKVEFIDSSSLGAIVSILKAVGHDGELVLASVSGSVRELFKITRMDQVIDIFDDRDAATAALSE